MKGRLKFGTLAQVALRGFFLESSWNNEGQQNLGLAAAMDPALKALYHQPEQLRQARERFLGFFNTNPIASGLALGALVKMEEQSAAGELAEDERDRSQQILSRILAAMGDALFWQAWLPICGLAAVWGVLSVGCWWLPLTLPVAFCALALPLRLGGFYLGYRRGRKLFDLLMKLNIQRQVRILKRLTALLVGACTVSLLYGQLSQPPSLWTMALTLGAVAALVGLGRYAVAKIKILNYWYPLLLITAALMALAIVDGLWP